MAGRGTDIKLGEGVKEVGGLAILGTERHESRRIDNQLRGRAGRQGDPGFTQFYVSMKDDLMRRFGGEKMASMMEKLGIAEDEAIQNKMISNSVRNAQKKIEAFHFDARKHVVQYDDVMNVHREKIYALRARLLKSEDISEDLDEIFAGFIKTIVDNHILTNRIDVNTNIREIAEIFAGLWEDVKIDEFEDKLRELSYKNEIEEFLLELLKRNWSKKKESFPLEQEDKVSRYILLKSIDELWLEHINDMTNLRDRVSLSGYAQKDPVMEYKREAFLMFKSLLFNIRRTAITNLFLVKISREFEMETADYSGAQTNEDQIEGNLSNSISADSREKHFTSDSPGRSIVSEKLGKKYENIGRNEPCPCGSGKKFKKCHGKEL
jgi:preprotein translocase subunit SecA